MSLRELGTLALGAVAVVWGVINLRLARESTGWPSVQGSVLSTSYVYLDDKTSRDPANRERSALVVYKYQLDTVSYRGHRVTFSEDALLGLWSTSEQARVVLEKYRAGSPVTVFYRPGDPAMAVLEPGGGWEAAGFILVGLGCIGYSARQARRA